jgi:tripartite-type tricarboxylate transporter receptor subunit TctC
VHVKTAKVLGSSDVRAQFAVLGVEPGPTSPEAFAALIKFDSARWAALIKASGIRADEIAPDEQRPLFRFPCESPATL